MTTIFTHAELATLASLSTNETIASALAKITAAQAAHVVAKNEREAANAADKDAKGGIWESVLEIALEIHTLTSGDLKRIREQAFAQVLGEYLSKDYPVATVRAYTSTGKNVLMRLCGVVSHADLRAATYKEVRDMLSPKGEGVVLWEATQKGIADALSKAKKYLSTDPDAVNDMAAILELAQSLHQRAEAAKQAKQKTPENARNVNAMREIAESIGTVASVIDNGPASATGTEG